MSNKEQLVVQQAIEHFEAGDFDQARVYYEQARERYGKHLFAECIELCDLRSRRAWASYLSTKINSSSDMSGYVAVDEVVTIPSKTYSLKSDSWYELSDMKVPIPGAGLMLKASVCYQLLSNTKSKKAVVLFEFFDGDGNQSEKIFGLGFSSVFKKQYRYLNDNSDNLQDSPKEIVNIKLDDNIARVKIFVAPLGLRKSEQINLRIHGCLFKPSAKPL